MTETTEQAPKKKCKTTEHAVRAGVALVMMGVAHQFHAHWKLPKVAEAVADLSEKVLGDLEVMVGRRPSKEELAGMEAAFADMIANGFAAGGDDLGLGL